MEDEVIDLTQSFTYYRAPINMTCGVIELDDSIDINTPSRPVQIPVAAPTEPIVIECDTDALPAVNVSINSQRKKSTGIKKKKRIRTEASSETQKPHIGVCPICRDPLGTRPMASTKCGHVYCIPCIDQAVKIEKRCPTCRKPLKGATAYHPLFL